MKPWSLNRRRLNVKPATGFAGFLARLLSNENAKLFTVRLGTQLLLARFGLVGFVGELVGFFMRGLIGLLIEDGTFLIDLALDAYKEGQKLAEFKVEAKKAYEKATAKIYDEEKKNEIRKQYLDLISKFGIVGDPHS